MRGSGKTTRMVEEALMQSAEGRRVLIFALNALNVHYICGVIDALRERYIGMRGGQVSVFVYSPQEFRERTSGFRGEWFIDHAVEEGGAEPPFRSVWAPPVMACDFALHRDRAAIKSYFGHPSRESRFDTLRAEGKKLGEINAILEAEGYSESFGEGVMPCPTKSHEIVRENKGAKQMIAKMGAGHA